MVNIANFTSEKSFVITFICIKFIVYFKLNSFV